MVLLLYRPPCKKESRPLNFRILLIFPHSLVATASHRLNYVLAMFLSFRPKQPFIYSVLFPLGSIAKNKKHPLPAINALQGVLIH